MTQQRDAWTVLAERGEWRGADEIALRALDELDRGVNGKSAVSAIQQRPAPTPLSPADPARRRVPGLVVAAAAFVVVIVALSAVLVLPRLDGGAAPGTDDTTPSSSIPPTTLDDSTVDTPIDGVTPAAFPIPGDFVPTEAWPSPGLAPVLNLQRCPTQAGSPSGFLPDSFFEFLGVDRQAADLVVVDPSQVAASTPILRAGSMSILSMEAIDSGCLVAVSNGTVTGWGVFLAGGDPAMMALSLPWPDNTVPDSVSNAPGEYQQWRIATGELFTGNVSSDGQVHVMANQRLYVASFDPSLIPEGGRVGGWLMASLAITPIDTERFISALEGTDVAVPTALPPGFGVCGATQQFLLYDTSDGPEEEGQYLVICDASGTSITFTSGTAFATVPPDAASVDINGHETFEWSTPDHRALYFSRSGLDVLVQAPIGLDPGTFRAVVATMPLASPLPPPPSSARALIGVGDGIDPETLSPEPQGVEGTVGLSSPAREGSVEDVSLSEMIAQVRASGIDVTLSESMRVIVTEGLDGLDATPFLYQFWQGEGVAWENGYFDVPSLNLYLDIGQQDLPSEWLDGNPIAFVEETWGVWRVSISRRSPDRIEIVAYSPSIERQVRIGFASTLFNAIGRPDPLDITVDEARAIAQSILDSIAAPN